MSSCKDITTEDLPERMRAGRMSVSLMNTWRTENCEDRLDSWLFLVQRKRKVDN